jgi:hypothetical protein
MLNCFADIHIRILWQVGRTFRMVLKLKNIITIVEFVGIEVACKVLLTQHITYSANDWGILNGCPPRGFS